MSDPSVTANPSLGATGLASPAERHYELSDDLARLCLPQEFKDTYRNLAWANSICCLFLIIGLVGVKAPKVIVREIQPPTEVVPVVFTPPEEQPKPEPIQREEEPQDTPEVTTETPQVVTVVAAADAPDIAFSVPVQGAVAIAPTAKMASPPPPTTSQQAPPAPRPVQFNPEKAGDSGYYPDPSYPQSAMRNRYAGTVKIEIHVDKTGKITEASVLQSSGYDMLDDAALDVVKRRWRFPTNEKDRILIWPCIFQLSKR